MVGTTTALLIAAGIGAGGSVGAAALGRSAANKATEAGQQAAMSAAEVQARSDRESLDFLRERLRRQDEQDEPFRLRREEALAQLANLLGLPSGWSAGGGGIRNAATGTTSTGLFGAMPTRSSGGTQTSASY